MTRRTITLSVCLLLVLTACSGSDEPEVVDLPVDSGTTVAPTESASEPEDQTPTLPPPVVITESGEGVQPEAPVIEGEGLRDQSTPWPADAFGYGIQSHAIVGDPRYALEVVGNQLGLDWVKVQLEWALVEPEPGNYQWHLYDGIVNDANLLDVRLMLSIVGAPPWSRAAGTVNGPPDDYSLYASFLSQLLDRYPGQIQAIEVWNEQNLDREWATTEGLNPVRYVEFLALAYEAIKARDANIIVISGALAPTGIHDTVTSYDDFIYLDEALGAGLLNYADCVGAHHNGYNIGPDVSFDETGAVPEATTAFYRGPFDNPHHSWSFKTTINTYAEKVKALDPSKKLCVTEFGWASSEGYDTYPENFEFAVDNSLEEQARFIVQAFQQMRDSGDVWLAFLFNLDFGNKGGGPTDDPVPYSIIDTGGVPRPAFAALAEMPKPR